MPISSLPVSAWRPFVVLASVAFGARDPLLAAGAYLVAPSLEETRNQVAILAQIDAPATRSEAADETAVPEPQAAPA